MVGGWDLLRKIWDKTVAIYEKLLTMTDAQALLQQARDLIARQSQILDHAMQQLAAKDATIATLRDELARAQIPNGILLSTEEYRELRQQLGAGDAKLTELDRLLNP